MPLAVIHTDEMSKDLSGRRSEKRFGDRFRRRAHSAKVVGQDVSDGAGARRHPELELVVVIVRFARYQICVIVIRIGVGYRRDRILRNHHLISSLRTGSGEWGVGNGEWGMGNGGEEIITPHSPLPTPHSPLPTFIIA